MATPSPASLSITAGLHQGAKVELALGRLLLVGGDPNCDVVLADAGIAGQQLALLAQAERLTLRALADGIRIDGKPVASGSSTDLADTSAIALPGGVALQLKRRKAVARGGPRWRNWLAGFAILLLGSGLTAIAALDEPPRAGETRSQRNPQQIVHKLGLGDQVEARRAGNGWYLSGVVANEALLDRLRQETAQLDTPVTLAVTSAPQLVAEVAALLRLKGVNAAPRYLGGGVVAADGGKLSPSLRQSLATTARRDIRGLSELRFDGLAPARPAPETPVLGAGGTPADPDAKRVVSVVEGLESYVVTADGSRYFEGAWLPSGHRVEQIADGKVWLVQGRQRVELAF